MTFTFKKLKMVKQLELEKIAHFFQFVNIFITSKDVNKQLELIDYAFDRKNYKKLAVFNQCC